MNNIQRTHHLLKGLRQLTAFLKNLWGILAVVSIFFPVINHLAQVVPFSSADEGGILVWFAPALFSVIAVLICLTTIPAILYSKDQFKTLSNRNRIRTLSLRSFGLGLASLLVYLVLYYFFGTSDLSGLQIQIIDGQLLGEALLLCLYAASFGLTTRGFALLSLGEYLEEQ